MAKGTQNNTGDKVDEAPNGYLHEILGDPDYFHLMARFSKRHYDALLKAGFTPDQAITIVAHSTPMTMMNI